MVNLVKGGATRFFNLGKTIPKNLGEGKKGKDPPQKGGGGGSSMKKI